MLNSERNRETVEKLRKESPEFGSLYKDHIRYEQDLEALFSLKYMPPEVETKIKEIKVAKLKGKDRMVKILSDKKV